jgi:tetratricopeptide (TPR) repeat protein
MIGVMKRRQLLIYTLSLLYPLAAFSQQTPSSLSEAIKRARGLFNKSEQPAPSPSPQQAAEALNQSGFDKYRFSDYDGAIADYTKAIEINPKYTEAYCNRGTAKLLKRDYDGAYADGNQAIALDPKDAEAYSVRGQAKSGKSDYDGAIADLDQAISLSPSSSYFTHRAIAKRTKHDLDGAIADFTKAIELNPTDPDILYQWRGEAKRMKHDLDGAIADYTQAIALKPSNAFNYHYRGEAEERESAYDKAVADYDKEIDLEPKFTGGYIDRGGLEVIQENYDGAMADFNKAIELEPKLYWVAFAKRGQIKEFQGDLDGALQDYLRCETSPPYRFVADYARLRIWAIRTRKGQTTQANQELSDYLTKRSDGKPEDWLARVAQFLLGQTSEPDFLAAATSSDEYLNRSQSCQAWYYCGLKQLLSGNKKLAAEYFAKSMTTGQTALSEYASAKFESKALGAAQVR